MEKAVNNFCLKAGKDSNCEQKSNSQLYSQKVVCVKLHKGNYVSKCLIIA